MSIEKERKAFESQNFIKRLLGYSKYDEDRNEYVYFRFEDYAIRDTCELNTAWKAWQASANREGYKLVSIQPDNKTIVSIERMVENQIEASGINQDLFRLDGENIYKAMIGACDE